MNPSPVSSLTGSVFSKEIRTACKEEGAYPVLSQRKVMRN